MGVPVDLRGRERERERERYICITLDLGISISSPFAVPVNFPLFPYTTIYPLSAELFLAC